MFQKPLLIYLHGFNSSPGSHKACLTLEYIDRNRLDLEVWIPQLPSQPFDIQQVLLNRLRREFSKRPIYIIGSSLGGYIGTWLNELIREIYPSTPTRLVLINPVVRPYELLHDYLGWQSNEHSGEKWLLTEAYVEQLKTMEVAQLSCQENMLLLVQTGDETLDYRKSVKKYSGAEAVIEEGGNHQFEGFEKRLPYIFEFLAAHCL